MRHIPVPDPDFEIRGAPVIQRGGGGEWSPKIIILGDYFGLKIRGGGEPGRPGPSPGPATAFSYKILTFQ